MDPHEIMEDEDACKPLYTKQEFQLHRVLAGELVFDENKQRAVLLKKPRCAGNEGTYKLLLAQHTANTTRVAWVTLLVFHNIHYDETCLLRLACQGVVDDIDDIYIASEAREVGDGELHLGSRFYCCRTVTSEDELCHVHEAYPPFTVSYADRSRFLLDRILTW